MGGSIAFWIRFSSLLPSASDADFHVLTRSDINQRVTQCADLPWALPPKLHDAEEGK